ncbi:hypothetical protein F5B19DRAFT_467985 [Rostrohypoxylon terebratum]|nr:hypothetical protein F5B19DRAFT_467985 [Rostrohypoxylon terebratum]
MTDLTLVRARWDFLSTIHPLFLYAESFPMVEDADGRRYGYMTGDEVNHLKNEITMLRNDFKLNIIKQQQVEFDLLTAGDSIVEELQFGLEELLGELETLVDPNVLDSEELGRTDAAEALSSFPKLIALRNLLRQQDNTESEDQLTTESDPAFHGVSQTIFAQSTESNRGKRYSFTSLAQAAIYISFSKEVYSIESCRRVVSRFGRVLDRLLGDTVGSWAMEAQMLDYTDQDVEAIEHAYGFASACTSLFNQMANSNNCGTLHQARLHLSGFKMDELRMNIDTCQETGCISASFIRSYDEPSPEPFDFGEICSQYPVNSAESDILRIAFNPDGMWAYPVDNSAGVDSFLNSDRYQYASLDSILIHQDCLTPKYRKLIGVLLAASLFQLGDSPWIEQQLKPDTIFVPLPPDRARLQQWCPRVICDLLPKDDEEKDEEKELMLQSDTIAAFGVLVLELEADRQAPWDPSDNDWLSGEKSNQVRLARILKSWEELISDDYRGVARACLEFTSLIDYVNHSDIGADKKGLAIIYKCILEPLFRHMMKSFGTLGPLFKGMFGPVRSLSAPMNLSASSTAKRILFDDDEATSKPADQISAGTFLLDLKPFFQMISQLHMSEGASLAIPRRREKIRIAVLDSGIDETDPKIRPALKFGRIRTCRSFVGRPDQWQDSHGHGTHVTRLLLETAPRAEIFVAKICTGKMINDEFMPGIAKAIDWAVEECDADIISMSFGFEEENELIDSAVDNAIEAGKLIFAAASNNGGITGRARPARYEGVICVHATDGKGNKGGMNPTPLINDDNFATLGVAVPSKWKSKEVWKTGTSFSTPIAAGFAADVLEFINWRCTRLTSRKHKLLYKKRGMQAMFRKMAEHRDGYDFIHPGRLWQNWHNILKVERDAAQTIEDVMQSL